MVEPQAVDIVVNLQEGKEKLDGRLGVLAVMYPTGRLPQGVFSHCC